MVWKDKFQKHILKRGYHYTYNVKKVERKGNHVEACVSGSRNYSVRVNLDDYSMSCTCPYFERDNCKHIAAVLYYLEEEARGNLDVGYEDSSDIEEVFDTVSVEDRLDFLLDLLVEEPELSNRFRQRFAQSIDRDYYVEKLSDILLKDDFDYKLSEFIENDMEYLYDLKEYDLLVVLLKSITEAVLDEMRFDDYYYGCDFDDLKGILNKLVGTRVRSKVFDMINWQLQFNHDVYGLESLIDFYAENFTNDDELQEKLEVIDELLDKSSVYEEELVLMKINTMKSLSMSQDEIDEFRGKYSRLAKVKQTLIDEAVENGDYDKAIRLIKKELNRNIGFISKKDYDNQLKELYLKVNDKDNYKKQLEEVLFKGYPDIDDYTEYKKLSDNWIEEREEFFKRIDDHYFLNECYSREKLYDRLVLNLRDEYDLGEYRDVLKEDYSPELLDAYLRVVDNMVSKSGTRKHYRKIIGLLKDMQSINGGDDLVRDLVENWKVKYKRRTAMMEELRVLS